MFGHDGEQPNNYSKEYLEWRERKQENEFKQAKQEEPVNKICQEGVINIGPEAVRIGPEVVRELYNKGSLKDKIKAFGLNESNAYLVVTEAIKEEQIKIQAEELRKQLEEAKKQPPVQQNVIYQAPSAVNAEVSEHNMVFDGRTFDPLKDDKLTNLSISEKIMLKMAYGG